MNKLGPSVIFCVMCTFVAASCSESADEDNSQTSDAGLDVMGDGNSQTDTATPPDLRVEANVDGAVMAACGAGGGSKNGTFDITGSVLNTGTQTATNATCTFTAEATSTPPDGAIASGTLVESTTVNGMEEETFSGQFSHEDDCQADYDISVTVECSADNEPGSAAGPENEVTQTGTF